MSKITLSEKFLKLNEDEYDEDPLDELPDLDVEEEDEESDGEESEYDSEYWDDEPTSEEEFIAREAHLDYQDALVDKFKGDSQAIESIMSLYDWQLFSLYDEEWGYDYGENVEAKEAAEVTSYADIKNLLNQDAQTSFDFDEVQESFIKRIT